MPPAEPRTGLRWGVLLLAVLLVPPFVWWTLVLEEIYFAGWPTSVSIFYHCLCALLVLVWLNGILTRRLPKLALSRAEMLAIYTCLSAGVAVAGHDHQMVYLRGWTYALWRAHHDPTWARLADLPWPRWISIFDYDALDKVYGGFSTLYTSDHFRVWLMPLLFLSGFLCLIQLFGAALGRLMVVPWTDHERLTFPIAQLPLEMAGKNDEFWRNRALWVGFTLIALVDIVNGLHAIYPAVPELAVKGFAVPREGIDPKLRPVLPHFIRTFPWMVGLCYLLPTDLSLSVWVFFWLLRGELLVCALQGRPIPFPYQTGAVAPHIVDQGVGAYLVVFGLILHNARNHFKAAWQAALGRRGTPDEQRGYRFAFFGGALALIGMYVCLRYVGLQRQWAALAVTAYAIMVTVVCKIRGELGPPMYDLHFAGPDRFLALYVSPRNLMKTDWVGVGFLFGFNRGQRNLSLPHQLEGFWLQKQAKGSLNKLAVALVVTGILASVTTCWGLVHMGYDFGFERMAQARLQPQGWQRMIGWFDQLPGPHLGALSGLGAGAIMAVLLTVLRQRFIGFPLHPGGFILATNWAAELMWFPMLLTWLIKSFALRTGGVKAYRKTLPFFLGLVLGDFVLGGFWALVGWIKDIPTYSVTW